MHSKPQSALERSISRRHFLEAALAGGLMVGSSVASRALAARPVERNGKPHMKLSLAAYSFRQQLTREKTAMTLDDFVRLCADLNLDGVELTSYYFPKDFGDDYLIHLKQLTFRLGLDISGTAIANDFCLPPGPERDQTLAHTRKWIDHAAVLGAPVIRIFAGNVAAGDTVETALEFCIAGINECLEYAKKKGVCLALENHHGVTSTPEQMLKIVAGVRDSPWFGVNLDAGNFRTPDPYGDLAKIAPYAVNAQIKTDIFPSGRKEETDLARVVKILSDAGYRGYLVLEYEGEEEAPRAVPRHIDALRKLVRGV
ncbi:MAG: sugar phosphate isomerase/epimerase family protein [Planctomycetaceae bacterium]